MASPQTENGHTAIANELMEAICRVDIPGQALRVFLHILRDTYGWKRKRHQMSYTYISQGTGISVRQAIRSIKWLEAHGMVIVYTRGGRGTKHGNIIGPQKNYQKWGIISDISDTNEQPSISDTGDTNSEPISVIPDINISDTGDTKISVIPDTQQRKKKEEIHAPQKSPTENQAMFGVLCEVCGIDWHVASDKKKGQINQSGKILRDGGYTSSDVRAFGVWWLENDWRGQKGQAPTPSQIRDEICKWKNGDAGKVNLR